MRSFMVIDTKTGNYGVYDGGKNLEAATEGEMNGYKAWETFLSGGKAGVGVDKRRDTIVNDRFIILPYDKKEKNKTYNDPKLVGQIITIPRIQDGLV